MVARTTSTQEEEEISLAVGTGCNKLREMIGIKEIGSGQSDDGNHDDEDDNFHRTGIIFTKIPIQEYQRKHEHGHEDKGMFHKIETPLMFARHFQCIETFVDGVGGQDHEKGGQEFKAGAKEENP